MDSKSASKYQKKKKGSKVKTFPVPSALEKIKESISRSTNTSKITSKEAIINQAIKFHLKGNILEAEKNYQYCLKQGFNDHRVFINYSAILKSLGKSKEAEGYLRKAIELKPDLAVSHSNLGDILREFGKLKEAESSTRKAIELNPNLGEAHSNLGNILNSLGKLQEAEFSYRKAIELNPNFAEAHYNLGSLLSDQWERTKDLEKLKEAELLQHKAIELNSDLFKAHVKLGQILFDLGKTEEASISEWNAIQLNNSSPFLKSYRENAKLIKKTAFYVFGPNVFNHFKPIIEINPSLFEILVNKNIKQETITKILNDLNNEDIRIRYSNELIENKLVYEKLVSIRGDEVSEVIESKNNVRRKENVPTIKLLGKKNIRLMYAAGKSKHTISSFWNKYYDGILCYGPYHEDRLKTRHKIPTSQMGYPRFDKYFNPGFERNYLIKKFKCDVKKKTIVWLPTWSNLSSVEKYLKEISSLISDYNIVVRPHPNMKKDDPENYKKLFTVDFNYVDNTSEDNVQLFALADLMIFDYGGSMFGSLYLNKNFVFLEMNSEAKNDNHLGKLSSEDYLKSFFPDRIATLGNLKTTCKYCLNNPPSDSIMKSLREEFFNTNYQGTSANRAYELLESNQWIQ